MRVWLVAPDSRGQITGGHRYNAAMVSALKQIGVTANCLSIERARTALAAGRPGIYWVDTLYLAELPALVALSAGRLVVGLLVHYLPSLVEHGDALERADLSPDELAAIDGAGAFLVSSTYAAALIERLGAAQRPILCVEPGLESDGPLCSASIAEGVRAIVVANLTPGKRVDALLEALGGVLEPTDRFELRVVGGGDDGSYAVRCGAIAKAPPLAGRVSFDGALPHRQMLERLSAANLFVSASRMETFGIALAEARAAGVPIVAREGGNIAAHVDPAAGGRLVTSDTELARQCVALCRDPDEHARRLEAAHNARAGGLTWVETAQRFARQLEHHWPESTQ